MYQRKYFGIIPAMVIIGLFLIGIIFYNKCYDNYLDRLKLITKKDELFIPITSITLDHGIFFINSRYYITGPFTSSRDDLYDFYTLAPNAYLSKRANSDSIHLLKDGDIISTILMQ